MIKPNAIICHNGAEVLADDKIIYQCGIKYEVHNELIETIDKNFTKYNLAIEIDDKMYANFDASIYWGNAEYENIKNKPNKDSDKIIIGMESIKETEKVQKYLSANLYFEINEGKLGLIMNRGATKWNAIKKLTKYYGIDTRETIAFGDDINDL